MKFKAIVSLHFCSVFLVANAEGISESDFYRLKNSVCEIQADLGAGTGFVVDSSGFLLTNAHVVAGAKIIHVRFAPGQRYDATVVKIDQDKDLALLRVNSAVVTNRSPLLLGDSKKVKIKDAISTIGSPLNYFHVLTTGKVATLLPKYLITDISASQGNSGGPVFSEDGKVIGVATYRAWIPGASGLTGISRIEAASSILSEIPLARDGNKLEGLRAYIPPVFIPSAQVRPDLPEDSLLPSVVTRLAEEKSPSYTIKNPRDFTTYVSTPISFTKDMLAVGKSFTKRRIERGDTDAENGELIFGHSVDALLPVITIAVVPELRETTDSMFGKFLFGYLSKTIMRYSNDFKSMKLFAGEIEVYPLRVNRVYVGGIEPPSAEKNMFFDASDAAYAGVYCYPMSAFDTKARVRLQVKRATDEDDGIKFDFPRNLQEHIFSTLTRGVDESK